MMSAKTTDAHWPEIDNALQAVEGGKDAKHAYMRLLVARMDKEKALTAWPVALKGPSRDVTNSAYWAIEDARERLVQAEADYAKACSQRCAEFLIKE